MTADVIERMDRVVARLLADLPGGLDAEVRQRVDDPDLRSWTYLPGDRPGLCLEDAPPSVVDAVLELVDLGHSAHGAALVRDAMTVERHRRRATTGRAPRGDRYWWRLVGTPGRGRPWGWRLNGHHVAVHVVVDDGHVTLLPHFVGSEPARVDLESAGEQRILGVEEDLARDLLWSLDADQRPRGLASDVAPDDILTGADPAADPDVLPPGITWSALAGPQQSLLRRLVARYLDRLPEGHASRYWAEAVADPDALAFAWAGGERPGEPHYYCVRSPLLLIEYDNTQDGANHAHSVLRHLRDDFGGDALRRHRRDHH